MDSLLPELWDIIRDCLDIVMRARFRLVCRERRDRERLDLAPAWVRDHGDLTKLDRVRQRYWRILAREMASRNWPMPKPRSIVSKDAFSAVAPHELWVWWERDDKKIRYFDGLMLYMDSADNLRFTVVSSESEPFNGGVGYARLDAALYDSILHSECPACHSIGATWRMFDEFGYCKDCFTTISSRTRDCCPECTSTNINPDTSGFTWCGTCHHQFLNR